MAVVNGITTVQKRIQREAKLKTHKLTVGLIEAGLRLQRESMKIVPVDYGNLKASAFTRAEGQDTPYVVVTVGYTAAYAVYVHENLDAKHGAQFNQYYADELAAAKRRQRAAAKARRKPGPTYSLRAIARQVRATRSVSGPFRHNRGEKQQAKFLEQPFRLLRNTLMLIVGMRLRS